MQPKERKMVAVRLDSSRITGTLNFYREYVAELDHVTVKSRDRCPGMGDAVCETNYSHDGANHFGLCKFGNPDRGWGNGCGLFAKGSVCTCVQAHAKEKIGLYDFSLNDIEHEITLHSGDVVKSYTVKNQMDMEDIDLEHRKVGLKCHTYAEQHLEDKMIISLGGVLRLVHNTMGDLMDLPWRGINGEWHVKEDVIEFKSLMSDRWEVEIDKKPKVAVEHRLEMYPRLNGMIRGDGTANITFVGSVSCRVKLDGKVSIESSKTRCVDSGGLLLSAEFVWPYVKLMVSKKGCKLDIESGYSGDSRGEHLCEDPQADWLVREAEGKYYIDLICPPGKIEIRNEGKTVVVKVPGSRLEAMVNNTILNFRRLVGTVDAGGR